ncbi:MAG TPA: hypothetical protein VFX86_01350 [Candidatus Saccharimonadales bacterium]|nr:hypothetical protein [Candidatus Saccharimonadales bacterium]
MGNIVPGGDFGTPRGELEPGTGSALPPVITHRIDTLVGQANGMAAATLRLSGLSGIEAGFVDGVPGRGTPAEREVKECVLHLMIKDCMEDN